MHPPGTPQEPVLALCTLEVADRTRGVSWDRASWALAEKTAPRSLTLLVGATGPPSAAAAFVIKWLFQSTWTTEASLTLLGDQELSLLPWPFWHLSPEAFSAGAWSIPQFLLVHL